MDRNYTLSFEQTSLILPIHLGHILTHEPTLSPATCSGMVCSPEYHIFGLSDPIVWLTSFMPRLQCTIPTSSMLNFPLSAAMILDSRSPTALVIDITEHNLDHITSLERSLVS